MQWRTRLHSTGDWLGGLWTGYRALSPPYRVILAGFGLVLAAVIALWLLGAGERIASSFRDWRADARVGELKRENDQLQRQVEELRERMEANERATADNAAELAAQGALVGALAEKGAKQDGKLNAALDGYRRARRGGGAPVGDDEYERKLRDLYDTEGPAEP